MHRPVEFTYRARDTKLDRDVALKVLPQAFTDDPDRLVRFEREAKVLASLNHPNIGHIYGLEEAEGQKALVLELIEGPTLADRIAQGPIPVDEALPIAKQIAEALEAAHEAGVIHRDLKPANVKVKDDGMVKVLDFGLAKAFEPDAGSVSASVSPTISLTAAATQMGMVIGTAAYMAPEQAKGKQLDKRADVWAFGAVVYEMLTGQKPFVGDDVSDTLALVLKFEPEWDALPPDTPPRVRQLIQTCLQKEPKERVHDIADVRLAMKGAFETTVSAPAEPAAVPHLQFWQRPIPLLFVGAVLVLVAGMAAWSALRPLPVLVSRFSVSTPGDMPLANQGGFDVVISPAGTLIAYLADGPQGSQIFIRPIDELEARPLLGTESASDPFFSPDGRWIGFESPGQWKLLRVAVEGGPPLTISDFVETRGAMWGTDDVIVYATRDGLWRVSAAGGGVPERLTPESD